MCIWLYTYTYFYTVFSIFMQKIWWTRKLDLNARCYTQDGWILLGVLLHTGFGTIIKKQGKEWKFHKQKIVSLLELYMF